MDVLLKNKKPMEEKHKVEKLFADVKEYAETKLDLAALNIQDKSSEILASAASVVTLGIAVLFVLLFLSLGAALIIGHVAHNTSIGFFSVAGFYLIVFILLFVYRDKWIKIPVVNSILRKIHFHEND